MSKMIVSPLTGLSSRQYFKSQHPEAGEISALSLTVSSASEGAAGTAKMVYGNAIRVSVSNASNAAVFAKFQAPFKLEITDFQVLTIAAGSNPTISLTRAGDGITAVIPASTGSSLIPASGARYWTDGNSVVETGSYIRIGIAASETWGFINVISYRPM